MDFKYDSNHFLTSNPNIKDNIELREPQIDGYFSAYEHFIINKKTSHALIVLPTGVGKTGLMGVLPYSISKGRVLIITPQVTIKDSIIDSLDPEKADNFWLKRKVFKRPSELPTLIEYEGVKTNQEVLEAANIVVLNIHKLQKRLDSSPLNFLPEDFFDMIIIDEAHHSTAKSWVDTVHYFSTAKVVKLTGTPFRTDNQKIAGELVYKYKLSQAMAKGYVKSLEDIVYVPDELTLTIDNDTSRTYTVDEIYDMGIKDEDWISRTVAMSPKCSEKIVNKSVELLEKKLEDSNNVPLKIIAVACSIEHAKQIQKLYDSKGYPTTIIHSDLNEQEKERAFSDIKNHRVKVVINVAMLGEGYDHPYLSIAAIFRPFRNKLPYAQFIGRILRVIPDNKISNPSDNIGQIISHEYLYLKDLWGYYKKQLQESEIIKYLKENDEYTEDDGSNNEKENRDGNRNKDTSVGHATEVGEGTLKSEAYLDTELIKMNKERERKREKKIIELQKILDVDREDAIALLNKRAGDESQIKRPDKYFTKRKKDIDKKIKEYIVPELLAKNDIAAKGDNLKRCILFRRRYSWIARSKSIKTNAGMLAVYFTNYLKNEIGKNKKHWKNSDYDIAYEKLDGAVEYVQNVLDNYVNLS